MENKRSFKGILFAFGKSLLYFAIYFLAQVAAINLIALIVGADYVYNLTVELTIVSGCISILLFALIFKIRKTTLTEMAYINKMPPRFFLSMIVLGISTAYAIAVILGLVEMSGIIPESWLQAQDSAYEDVNNSSSLMQFLSVGFMAPLLEEVLFRGLILGSLKKEMHPWLAIVISAVFFGVAHGTPIGIIYATVLGIFMGWIFVKFNSVLPGFLFHMAYNCTLSFSEGLTVVGIIFCVPILILEIIDINKYFRGKQL
ncbi:MAG: CPBP family intramembrane metalloprotease [Ruminococcaceae bacterium]|nr:CPBP family intramembrane metalloprotease [Oscillospiraceae bacterium]